MNAHADPATLLSSTRVHYTRDQIRAFAVASLERHQGVRMRTLEEIERADPEELRTRSVVGTVLAPVVTSLRARDIPIGYTFGEVEAALGFSRRAMHVIFCGCAHGPWISCGWTAEMIAAAAELEKHGNLLERSFDQGSH